MLRIKVKEIDEISAQIDMYEKDGNGRATTHTGLALLANYGQKEIFVCIEDKDVDSRELGDFVRELLGGGYSIHF